MHGSFQIVCLVSLCLTACQPKAPQASKAAATVGKATARETNKPVRPAIGTATVRQECLHYTSTTDGKMAIGGSVKMGTTVRVIERSADGWTQIRLSNGREASIPTEDLTTLKQFRRDRARARSARRGKFADPRPKIRPTRYRGREIKLPTAPPPPDFMPPPLPDAPLQDPLSNVPDILFQGDDREQN